MNVRKELIEHKLAEISDNVNTIYGNMPSEFEDFVNMGLVKHGLYKMVEFVIQDVIDICSILNSDLSLGMPENEDVLLEHINNKKIFSKNIMKKIKEMKGFRNILVHKYGEIDDNKAFEDICEGLKDFEQIIKDIEKFLEEQKREKEKERDKDLKEIKVKKKNKLAG